MPFKNIVVLHGERHIARLVQVNLERQGTVVNIATSPSQVLELIAREKPDALMADPSMRFLDGTDVFKTLRRHPSTVGIPIYILPIPGAKSANPFSFFRSPALAEFHDDDETVQ